MLHLWKLAQGTDWYDTNLSPQALCKLLASHVSIAIGQRHPSLFIRWHVKVCLHLPGPLATAGLRKVDIHTADGEMPSSMGMANSCT